jgi:hypothetical protein
MRADAGSGSRVGVGPPCGKRFAALVARLWRGGPKTARREPESLRGSHVTSTNECGGDGT